MVCECTARLGTKLGEYRMRVVYGLLDENTDPIWCVSRLGLLTVVGT